MSSKVMERKTDERIFDETMEEDYFE